MRPLVFVDSLQVFKPLGHPRKAWSIAAALLAVTIALYWPGLYGGFLFDDIPNLVHDPDWKVTSGHPDEWLRAVLSGISSNSGRPLAMLSFAVNHALTGMDPFWLKLSNVLMHALNGVLAWGLCRRLFAHLPDTVRVRPGNFAALLVAAAWLLHPLQASTVLYVVQRMEIGAATCVFIALLCYLRARDAMIARQSWWPWALGAFTATFLGLGFKESALLAPGFALIIEFALLRFRGPGDRPSRSLISTYCVVAVFGLAGYLAVALPIIQSPSAYGGRNFSLIERLLTQLPVLAMYLKQSLLPLPDFLSFHYDNFPVSRGLLTPPTTAISGLLLLAMAFSALALRRRMPLYALGVAWFYVSHAMTSNVIPLELAFEHRNYISLLGVLIALVQPACALGARLHADARVVMAALPVVALAWLGSVQAGTWGDPMRLAWTLENRNPTSVRASYGLGKELLLASGNVSSTPAWSLAYGQFAQASTLPGTSALPIQALLVLDGQRGMPIPSTRWQQFRDRLVAKPIGPEGASSLHAVSQCRIERRCRFQDEELLDTFLAVLARNPGNPTVHTQYANFLWNVAGDRALAIEVQREALALDPGRDASRIALAQFLGASGDPVLMAEGAALNGGNRRP